MKATVLTVALMVTSIAAPAQAGEITDVALVATSMSAKLFHTREPDPGVLDAITEYWESTPAPERDEALVKLLLVEEDFDMPGRLPENMPVYADDETPTKGAKDRWSQLVRRIEAIARRQTSERKSTNISSPDRIDFYIPENVLSFRMQNRNAAGGWLHLVGEGANYPGLFFQDRTAFVDSGSALPPGGIIYQLPGDFMYFVVDGKFQLTLSGNGDMMTASNARLSLGRDGTPTATLDVTGNAKISSSLDVAGALGIGGDLDVAGALGIGGDLDVTGALGIGGDLDVTGALGIGGDLDVTGGLTVNTDVLVVDDVNDRVGINNGSPSNSLDVTGSVRIVGDSSDAILNLESNDASAAWRLRAEQTDGSFVIRDVAGGPVDIVVLEQGAPADSLRLDASGNLQVAGTIEAGGAVFHGALSSAPSSPNAGDFYFDTTTSKHRGWDGSTWNNFY